MVCFCEPPVATTDERIKMAGFQCETHSVTSSDGYILKLFRIVTSARNSTASPKRRFPVMLQHGFVMSSDIYVVRNDALGFGLARDNWDVWLGNIRGTSYTRQHKWLSPNEPEFWNYSFDDIGRKDLPAMIDFILNHTRSPRLNYIGHSMGTTAFYVMASTVPSYNRKINSMISLSAVSKMAGWHFLLNDNSYFYQFIYEQLMKNLRRKKVEIFPRVGMEGLSEHQCKHEDFHLYMRVAFEFVKMVMIQWAHGEKVFPDSSSTKNFLHFLQVMGSANFQRYDYGREKNLKVWGSESPPLYNLSKIRAPMIFYIASGDLILEQDCENLARSLPNLVFVMKIPYLTFGHMDFLWPTSDLNLEYRRKMEASITDELSKRDRDLAPTDKIVKNICDHNKDCIKVM
ncbi:lipase 1-like [Nilaparvata lugens]|uniref:lipase 1-like n=1 Tax=Nilaparvata lugens TaxID=108931 RepID=UPI00193CE07C|nr:lipase 1-like [Nilaparvata lugens]